MIMKISLNQINEHLEKELSKEDVEKAFSLHAFEIDEIEENGGDYIFDVDVLPNRASDSLSVLGLARELSSILNIPLKKDFLQEKSVNDASEELKSKENNFAIKTDIDYTEYSNVYISALIEGVSVKESPDWLKNFLEVQGQKSINNIVDATNFVLFYLGQPTHAFDADKLQKGQDGAYHIAVRKAQKGEKIITLDNTEYELDENIAVIYDKASQDKSALAIAGIKGGADSAVEGNTKNIVLESARFDPTLTRKASQALSLRTDALKRFENNIADFLPFYGMLLLIDTILKIAGGRLNGVSVSYTNLNENNSVDFDIDTINKYLGANFSHQEALDILKRLFFKVEENRAKAPWWRRDINIWQDIAEELARIYGLDKISPKPIENTEPNAYLKNYYYAEKLRKLLYDLGFTELTNSTLQDKGELKLKNALASDKNYFRDNLSYAIEKALDKNENNAPLLGIYDSIKVFEIGTVYKNGKEYVSVAIAARPLRKKKREQIAKELLKDVKSKIEDEFKVKLNDPETEILEFPLSDLFTEPASKYPKLATVGNVQYKPFSQYPFVLRDVAAWLNDKEDALQMEKIIKKHGGDLLVRMDNFDVFEKDGRVSFAYHLVFQSSEKTLTDDEVNLIMQNIETELSKSGFEVR